jgi:hypothetical protein
MISVKSSLFKMIKVLFTVTLLSFLFSYTVFGAEGTTTVSEEKQNGLVLIPIFAYAPETGTEGGCGIFYYDNSHSTRSDEKIDTYNGLILYTEKNQILTSFGMNKYLNGDNYLLVSQIDLNRYPNKFYGIGPETGENMAENYTSKEITFKGSFGFKVNDSIYVGPYYHYSHFDVEDCQSNGLLTQGNIIGSSGTTASGIGIEFTWDKRNNQFYPDRGFFLNIRPVFYREEIGSSENFTIILEDYRKYISFKHNVFALQQYMVLSDSSVPFQLMPQLGGSNIMRGWFEGRFRDQNCVIIQGEYRFPVYKRFSGVVFGSVGQVAPTLEAFSLDNFKVAEGIGIRYTMNESQKLNFRLDVGHSEDGVQMYIRVAEAF